MELRHLRYFVAVAEELHFRRAAERLHVAQPAVSEQVRKLEEELGVRLLDRSRRNVSLTEAGSAFLAEARHVLDDAEVARHVARNVRGGAMHRLRIGYMPASLPASVPRTVQRLAMALASLETSLEPGSAVDLIEAVRARRLDAAIVSLPSPTTGLRSTRLDDARAIAAVPIAHRHAVASAIRLDQMLPERIVVLPREADRAFYDVIVATCRDAGFAPTLIEMVDGELERALLAVAAGAGMALLPASAAERYLAPGVRFVPLADPQPTVPMVVVTRRDTTHLPAAAFLRAVSHANRGPGRLDFRAALPTAA